MVDAGRHKSQEQNSDPYSRPEKAKRGEISAGVAISCPDPNQSDVEEQCKEQGLYVHFVRTLKTTRYRGKPNRFLK